MPIQYQKDRDGKWKPIGVAAREDSQPKELAAGSPEAQRVLGFSRPVGVQATRKGRPVVWAGPDLGWQSPKSFEKAKGQGRLPAPKPRAAVNKRTGWSWVGNELAWLGKGLTENMGKWNPLDALDPGSMLNPMATVGGIVLGKQGMAAMQVGAMENVAKSGEAAIQWATGKEVNPGQSTAVRKVADWGYWMMGAKPPSQQTPTEQQTDATFRTVGLNAAVSGAVALAAPLVGAGAGATALGNAVRGAGLFTAEQVISTALDNNMEGNASNLVEAGIGAAGVKAQVPFAVRPTDDWGEATWKSLVSNTAMAAGFGAGAGALGKAFGFTKRFLKESHAVSEITEARAWAQEKGLIDEGENGFVNRYSPPEFVGDLNFKAERPVTAMPDRGGAVSAPEAPTGAGEAGLNMQRPGAVMPERGGAMGVSSSGEMAPEIGDVALEGPAPTPQSAAPAPQGVAAERGVIGFPDAYSPVQKNLQEREAALNPDTAAYQEWLSENQQIRGIPSQQMEPGGAVLPGEIPRWEVEAGDPWVDPADYNPVADPTKVETDQLARDVRNLDDQSLTELYEQPSVPVVEGVRQSLGQRNAFDPAGDPRFGESAAGLAMGPRSATGFADLDSYADYLQSENWDGLQALTHPDNNPTVARWIEDLTGRGPEEWTKRDMIAGLMEQALQREEFVIPRPNGELYRPGEVVMPTADLGVDPARFQYKGGIDPTTGEQLGQSLDGIDAWNTNLEGAVSAWRDPVDESVWVLNGHNRVAAAKKLGVPSLPVKIYEAPDARAARAIGAAQNIAGGQGTPIDAAKFMRDSGITDVSQLQQLVPGMPLKSGWADQGLALSKLPDEAFNAVVQGDLAVERGAILGASGKTPQEMLSLWKYAEAKRLSNRVLKEVVAMTAPEATATPAALKQGTIWDALGQGSPEAEAFNVGLINKAKLSDRVGSLLSADKRLFAAVSKKNAAERLQAGAANTIDAAGSRAVADQASQVLGIFDRLKFQVGPIGDLLNQGVMRLEAGEKLDVVSKDISAQVADAMEQTMAGVDAAAPAAARVTAAMPSADQLEWAEGKLLSPRKLAARQKYEAEYKANEAQVSEYLDEMPGSNSGKELTEEQFVTKYGADESRHPRLMTKGKAKPKQLKELEDHLAAEQILERQRMAEQAGPAAVAAEPAPTPEAPQGPVRLDPQQREELQVELVRRAIDGDEVRPPATPMPTLFDPPAIPLSRAMDALEREGLAPGGDAAQAVADEFRLAAEYGYRQAAMEQAAKEANREATGYYELGQKERLASSEFRDGFNDAPIGDSLDDKAAYAREQRITAERSGDTTLAREWSNAERTLEKQRIAQAQQRQATSQEDMFGVGEYDSSTPLLNQPAAGPAPAAVIEIPEAAGRKITERTDPGRIEFAAQSLFNWTTSADPGVKPAFRSVEEALAAVRAKGRILDPDAIPGLDMDKARADQARGLGFTPTSQAVSDAFKQFYGVEQGGKAPVAVAPEAPIKPRPLKASPDGLVPKEQAKPLSPFGPMDLANREADLPKFEFVLSPGLANAKPRYGSAELKFASDLDKAAYILARDSAGASAAAKRYIRSLEAAGLDPAEVAAYGRDTVLPAVKAAGGGGAAPQKAGLTLDIPDQGFEGSVRLPKSERTRLENQVSALDAEIQAIDAEIAKVQNQAQQGGCF